MESARKWVVVFIATLLLQSCTVAHYQIRNKLSGNPSHEHGEPCHRRYSVSITSGSYTDTLGNRESKKDELQELSNEYIESTNKVLNQNGCATTYVEREEDATFKVRVERLLDTNGALAQEWLTGLSFGLIPSWGTRKRLYIYTFEDTKAKTKHRYIVDDKSYSHLLLFPIFWVNFITADELKVYEEALTNFTEKS